MYLGTGVDMNVLQTLRRIASYIAASVRCPIPAIGACVPSHTQWRTWSLPARLTAIGTLVGIVGLVTSVVFYVFPRGTGAIKVSPTVLSLPDSPAAKSDTLLSSSNVPMLRVYIESEATVTVDIEIDAVRKASFNKDTTFTSVDIPDREHVLVARTHDGRIWERKFDPKVIKIVKVPHERMFR
jgi:hypothetical protein